MLTNCCLSRIFPAEIGRDPTKRWNLNTQHYQSKVATLSEQKIKTSKVPSRPSQKLLGAKETVVKVKDYKLVATSEVVQLNLNESLLHQSDQGI
ncbi:hypothetical protein L6452_13559 [Arctium lappa]|uniref:Uncharacterized protein n=1 Tax=Arctium lappa TaxID=4217 RepID=A0ACB9CIX8_ARCLA|nr:hypothetical protein L6452_13559 [Arctium lappa]